MKNTAAIRLPLCFSLVALLTALTACGPRSYSVKGKVTLDGNPLPDARVSFMKQDDSTVYAVGYTNADGEYDLKQARDLEGAIVGQHLVRISTYRGPDEGSENPEPVSPEKIPDKYHRDSQEIHDVTAGENVINFDIKSTDGPITQPEVESDEEP